jgi:hypothetical protein
VNYSDMEKLSYGALAPPPPLPYRHAGRREIARQRIRGFTPMPSPYGVNRAERRRLRKYEPEVFEKYGFQFITSTNPVHQTVMPVPRTERRKVARELAKLEARGAV